MTNNLTMRWIPVAGATGRTHLEAVWVTAEEAPVRVAATQASSSAGRTETAATHAA